MGGGKRKDVGEALARYRARRDPARTPEPGVAGAGPARAAEGLFVVQKHRARRLHWDLRLELDGVLLSWAVPKGPSRDPETKRLAMEVEPHPVDYADFEGTIPEGNYGAGAVIVWDRGVWIPVEDPREGLARGKLLFDLAGYKLRGRWTLFRIGKDPREWLLMKKPDGEARAGDEPYAETSILSGRSVEDLLSGRDRTAALRRALARAGVPRRPFDPDGWKPMLAQAASAPDGDDRLYEIKYDGYRLLAAVRNGRAALRFRNGGDATADAPLVARAVESLGWSDLALDGELVALDAQGRPDFAKLQRREPPLHYFAFDLLAAGGFDLRELPLVERKLRLAEVLPEAGPLRYADHVEGRGAETFAAARALGLEGVVGKRPGSAYRAGRSDDWIKLRADRTGDFVVVGYRPERSGRGGLGALELAGPGAGGDWIACGSVGSGLDEAARRELLARLRPIGRVAADGAIPVEPELVCEVRFKERTRAGRLRQPSFLRLRPDLRPEDLRPPDPPPPPPPPPASTVPPARRGAGPRRPSPGDVPQTNREKIFWPGEGIAKGDLIDYYRRVAPRIFPYLRDRPLALERYPDGIDGKHFFQKDAPDSTPAWVRRETIASESGGRDIRYFVCDDEATLVHLVNLGAIPLHVWSSRVGSLERPDWCILDLDPKRAPFASVVRVARALRAACESAGIETYVKTSGSSGLHVLIPLGGACTHEQSRTLAQLLANLVVSRLPDDATVTRNPAKRGARVYVDFLQNGRGSLLVAPWSVRPLPGAPVSMPLAWSRVRPGLDPRGFPMAAAAARGGRDPFRGVLEGSLDLAGALERLQSALSGNSVRKG